MEVRWTTPEAQDLENIVLHIRKDSESTAQVVAEALFDAANSLGLMSLRGRAGRINGTRELVISGLPYIVVYRVTATSIQILHIYHGAQNWPTE